MPLLLLVGPLGNMLSIQESELEPRSVLVEVQEYVESLIIYRR